jgi:hypothetical protein
VEYAVGTTNVYFTRVTTVNDPYLHYDSSIYRTAIAGGQVPVLVTADGFSPVVSGNESKLAFTRRDGNWNQHSRLYVANGTLQRRLTNATPDVEFIPLEWSADSSRVLIFRSAPDRHSLHLASVGGSWSTVRSNGRAQPGAWYKAPGSL